MFVELRLCVVETKSGLHVCNSDSRNAFWLWYDPALFGCQCWNWWESREGSPKQGGKDGRKPKEIRKEKRKEAERGGRFPNLDWAGNPEEQVFGDSFFPPTCHINGCLKHDCSNQYADDLTNENIFLTSCRTTFPETSTICAFWLSSSHLPWISFCCSTR